MIMIWRWIFLLPIIWQQLVAKLVNDEEQQPVATIREDVFSFLGGSLLHHIAM